jgi:chaperonin GroEL
MTAKEVRFSTEAREKMLRGADILADSVKVTLGPRVGMSSSISLSVLLTSARTVVTLAKEIELTDSFENIGANLPKQAALKTGELAGDGTTTATLLAQAIVKEGAKVVAAAMNSMDIKRGIDCGKRDCRGHSQAFQESFHQRGDRADRNDLRQRRPRDRPDARSGDAEGRP